MFLQVSLTQFDCARSFIRLSPGMSLNFNFAIDFKNKIATEQKFPCVSTANGTITGFECEPFLLAFSWQPLYFNLNNIYTSIYIYFYIY